MTNEEIIYWLKQIKDKYIHGGDEEFDTKRNTALDMAIQAIEKQTPKMVNYTAHGYADGSLVYDMAECPNCGMYYEESDQFWESKFCLDCGQALEWEKEE